jgi:hypothetical protein
MGFLGFQCRCANIRLTFMAASYFQGHERIDPMISPLFGDFRNLPPIFLTATEGEVLFSDTTRMAERAKQAGVDVTVRPVKDSVHVFPLFSFLPEAQGVMAAMAEWGRHVPVGPQRDAACCRLSQALTRSARLLHANRYPPRIKSGAGFRWKMLSAPYTAAVTARCAITLTRLAR